MADERKLEERQYTDAVVAALIQSAVGETLTADATAAVETAAGFWGRAFASATVDPADVAAWQMAAIGRDLIRRGESVWLIDVQAGEVTLLPVTAYQIEGASRRESWTYRVQINAPSAANLTRQVSGAEVLHCRYSTRAEMPWLGISPLTWAVDTAKALGGSEARLKEEAGTPTGYVMPTPNNQPANVADGQDDLFDPMAQLKAQISQLAGKLLLVESMQAGWGDGRGAAPTRDWVPQRLGADPPEGLLNMRRAVQDSILAACGVPPGMAVAEVGSQQSSREQWRQFLHGTIQPVATLVQEEMRDKLARPGLTIGFDRLFASDLQGRARAFQSMVGGGMEVERAAALSGLMLPETDE